MTVSDVWLALPWLIAAAGLWLAWKQFLENGRLLLRVTSVEGYLESVHGQLEGRRPQALPQGLPPGMPAPPFELPDLDDRPVALEQFRGRPVLLIFFSPACRFCLEMAPGIAALPADGGGGRPVPVLVSTGDREANRRVVEEHGIRCPVLLQQQMEVASRYGALGSPLGYLVDENGILASPMVIGAAPLLALASDPTAALDGAGAEEAGEHDARAPVTLLGTRGLAGPDRYNRRGLPPGSRAPRFKLPLLGGGKVTLEDYTGRPFLLVFADPHCPACDKILPELEQLRRAAPGLEVLMISRGEPDENRKKVAELGLTFPVALQRGWEVSRLYRKFATPVAYQIGAHGRVISRVAEGGEILALAAQAARPPGEEAMPMRWRTSE